MIVIKEISKKKDIKTFINFPDKLYKGEKNYIPELKSDEMSMYSPKTNFAFEYSDAKFFLCYKDDEIAGRVGAIVNHKSNDLWNQKRIRITRIDFIDDMDVSDALFGAVEDWAKELGLTEAQGPLGFTDLDKEGLLIEGFDRMGSTVTIYNYPYYPKHFEAHGYTKDTDWIEYRISVPKKGDTRTARVSEIAKKVMKRSAVRFYELKKMKDAEPIIIQIFSLISECYKDLYGNVPYTEKIARDYLRRFIPLLTRTMPNSSSMKMISLSDSGWRHRRWPGRFKSRTGGCSPLDGHICFGALITPKNWSCIWSPYIPTIKKQGLRHCCSMR